MTADSFTMDCHYRSWRQRHEWEVKVEDNDMKTEFWVCDEDVQTVLSENFDLFSDTVRKELLRSLDSLWDDDLVTDEEKRIFTKILEAVIE